MPKHKPDSLSTDTRRWAYGLATLAMLVAVIVLTQSVLMDFESRPWNKLALLSQSLEESSFQVPQTLPFSQMRPSPSPPDEVSTENDRLAPAASEPRESDVEGADFALEEAAEFGREIYPESPATLSGDLDTQSARDRPEISQEISQESVLPSAVGRVIHAEPAREAKDSAIAEEVVRGLKGGEDIPLPASGARQRPGKRDILQKPSKAQDDEVMQRRASSLPAGTASEDALAELTERGAFANGLRSQAKKQRRVEPPVGDKIATFPTANEEEPVITPAEEAERFAEAEPPIKSHKRKAQPRAAGPPHVAGPTQARQMAQRFLAEYASLEGLSFREATGYWANTYVPGDPAMRLVEARLRDWDRTPFRAVLARGLNLERVARQNWQPFDPPRGAALALYLHADRRAVQGPTRLRVQVGLKGSRRQSGYRPAMNVGMVLDLRSDVGERLGTEMRALLMALAQARQPGDRFSLSVAGRPSGQRVPAEHFRYGPLQVAVQRLFGPPTEADAPKLDLVQAVSMALEDVRRGDDPTATLGASLVLLVTASPLGPDLPVLEHMAHTSAVNGIALSVVPLGDQVDLDEVDRLVMAGQGQRRLLSAPDEAPALIDRELYASSRAVARAVRLRIRLAPGVKLIDVMGSYRLDEPQAQHVREAERSIDRRLARNLGIRADRGQDEEGIQVVIPSFYADDAHAILLDVVVDRPGPVADVTVRYKDLVYLRNGVARANLTLGAGDRSPGPLERNVLKNLLALKFAEATREASRHLAAGDRIQAVRGLASLRQLLQGLRAEVAGWSIDAELMNDERILAEYSALLQGGRVDDGEQRQYLADSLRYASFRRLVPGRE